MGRPVGLELGRERRAKLLMLRRAFEELECLRVEFKTDALDAGARAGRSAIPLPETQGVHRLHKRLLGGGQRRDSAWYSVIADEWPAVEADLERRLSARLR